MDRPSRLLRPLLALALGLLIAVVPGQISLAFPSPPGATPPAAELSLDQRARQAYASGNYGLARDLWQRAADSYANTADPLNQAMVLSNLSLALQHLGQAAAAQQTIEASLELLQAPSLPLTRERKGPAARTLAQALNTQARLRFEQGETLEALRGWQRAGELYRRAGDGMAALASSVNQAEALRILGNQREAVELLEPVVAELERQPPSSLRAAALLSLAGSLQSQGDAKQALQLQRQSLASAEAIASPAAISAAQLAIANSQRDLGRTKAALRHYQLAQQASPDRLDHLLAQTAQLSLLVDSFQYAAAAKLWPPLLAAATNLPSSRRGLDASLNLASSLLRLQQQGPALPFAMRPQQAAISALLKSCLKNAEYLGDSRSRSIALGSIGQLEESAGAWSDALRHSQEALQLALPLEESELSSRWWWQLGRIARQRGDRQTALQAYDQAIAAQQQQRKNLAGAANPLQSAFGSSVEPLYRQYIDLLTSGPGQSDPEALQRSRQIVEAMQIAEINDFFQEACLQPTKLSIDQIDPRAAVIYPIRLPNRLEVIVRLPGASGALIAHSVPLADGELERSVAELERLLYGEPIERSRFAGSALLPAAQQLYDWILRPLAAPLKASGATNLVFVPDAVLRNLPMAVLHDGQNFLGQGYGIALAPGLQLRSPGSGSRGQQRLLLAGISESRQSLPALANVNSELLALQKQMGGTLLLNSAFTREALRQALATGEYSVVHLATHGQFGSNAADTYLLTWDKNIGVTDIDALLQPGRRRGGDNLELLVLSACQTAAGDPAANLGLAAMAVRSGASSTLASLWPVSDGATANFMAAFYEAWQGGRISKVDALRQAQQQLIASPNYQHPFYWAAFTLLGNWS
jgi:CHAT domain-containing protein